MRHLIIAAALLAFAGLDVVFVEFSDTPTAALMFALLSFLILLILSGAAGGYSDQPDSGNPGSATDNHLCRRWVDSRWSGLTVGILV